MKQFVSEVLDEPQKRILAYSFIIYFPVLSLLVGAPIPFPASLLDVSPEQIAIFNFMSLLITIIGSIVGVGFYLERRNNIKLEAQKKVISDIEDMIDEKSTWLHTEMKDVEGRICDNFSIRISDLQRHSQTEVERAKELADQKILNIGDNLKELRKAIQNIERNYHKSSRYTNNNILRRGGEEEEEEEKEEEEDEANNDNG